MAFEGCACFPEVQAQYRWVDVSEPRLAVTSDIMLPRESSVLTMHVSRSVGVKMVAMNGGNGCPDSVP